MDLFATGTAGAVFLGILQGLTEFLPVSSSGHLVVFQQFIEVQGDAVLFDLLLHLGTLLPAVWFYRRDVVEILRDTLAGTGPFLDRPGTRLGALVVMATLPTVVVGLALEDVFEALFHEPLAVAVAFAATGAWLWSTRGRDEGEHGVMDVPWRTALLLGLAQAAAITPGVSRSGSTIAAALLLGVRRELAVKLSFLMSIPAILGASVLRMGDLDNVVMAPSALAMGTLAAAVTGYGALVLLVRLVRVGRFADFSWYLWGIAAVTAAMALTGFA